MTKPRVPNTKAQASGPPPKAGDNSSRHPAQRPQHRQRPPLAQDGTRRVVADDTLTEPRTNVVKHPAPDPPAEAAKGDDDAMSQPQTVTPGSPVRR